MIDILLCNVYNDLQSDDDPPLVVLHCLLIFPLALLQANYPQLQVLLHLGLPRTVESTELLDELLDLIVLGKTLRLPGWAGGGQSRQHSGGRHLSRDGHQNIGRF